jgi:hypothetical protein
MSNPNTDDLLARLQALPPDERARLLQQLGLAPTPNPVVDMGGGNQFGATNIGDIAGRDVLKGEVALSADARINGVAVGVNLGTIIYGRDPSEDERRQLAWYLARLASKLSRLPLRGLEERLDQGDGVALARVYVMLATRRETEFYQYIDGMRFFVDNDPENEIQPDNHPDWQLPDQPIVAFYEDGLKPHPMWTLLRAVIATEALIQHARLVLLGDPGSGKSTFLRHLAWALARRGLDQGDETTALPGWG